MRPTEGELEAKNFAMTTIEATSRFVHWPPEVQMNDTFGCRKGGGQPIRGRTLSIPPSTARLTPVVEPESGDAR